MQIFNLHEAHGDYHPASIVEKLSSVHKDQVFAFGDHHEPPPDADKPGARPLQGPAHDHDEHDDRTSVATYLLKWFFTLVAGCLIVSTAFGIWMGLTQIRARRLAWSLLIVGTLLPVALLAGAP
ncbi:MAG TPA: hypothetical protein VMF03_17635 [Steroidobacteraceae bacterium]|nr:hypothetical protein [Steroidobacteraceae bacterium]